MPLYEYRCTSCGYSFEKIQSFSAAPESVCPKCQGELIRPVTAPALRFEGAGWYVNDYAGKGASKSTEAPSAGSDTKAESKAEGKAESSTGSADSKAPAATPAAAPAATSAPASSTASAS